MDLSDLDHPDAIDTGLRTQVAERLGHRLLRGAHITGWQTNLPVYRLGFLYYVDIAFAAIKLVMEVDGRFHEDDASVFEADRWRQNALVLSDWRVHA